MTTNQKQNLLFEIALNFGACTPAQNHIRNIKSDKDFVTFISTYRDEIWGNLDEIVNTKISLSAENVIEWFESPFVSDYDKERVREKIERRLSA
jgi:hypothetical protein